MNLVHHVDINKPMSQATKQLGHTRRSTVAKAMSCICIAKSE